MLLYNNKKEKEMFTIPELPEVENVRLSVEPHVVGKKIIKVELDYNKALSENAIKKIFHKQSFDLLADRIENSYFSELNRRGKYLQGIIQNDKYEDELYMVVHLGMAGAFIAAKDEESIIPKFRKHIHVKMTLEDGSILVFSDIRRHGGFSVYTTDEFVNIPSFKNLGPEPFRDDTMMIVLNTLRTKKWNEPTKRGNILRKSIKAALMDQSVMAGTGNIYACEALFETNTNPKKLVNELTDEELISIFSSSRDLMKLSISLGGTTFRDYVNGEGDQGGFQDKLKVYGKKECIVCNSKIISEEVAGRTTHWCPKCQS